MLFTKKLTNEHMDINKNFGDLVDAASHLGVRCLKTPILGPE